MSSKCEKHYFQYFVWSWNGVDGFCLAPSIYLVPYQVKTYLCTSITGDVSTALGIVSSLVNCCCRVSREAQNTFYRYSNTKIVDYYYSSAMQCWFKITTFIHFRGYIPFKFESFKRYQVPFISIYFNYNYNYLTQATVIENLCNPTTSDRYKTLFKIINLNLEVQCWLNSTQNFIKKWYIQNCVLWVAHSPRPPRVTPLRLARKCQCPSQLASSLWSVNKAVISTSTQTPAGLWKFTTHSLTAGSFKDETLQHTPRKVLDKDHKRNSLIFPATFSRGSLDSRVTYTFLIKWSVCETTCPKEIANFVQ